jgi:dihydropteroate synthase
MGVVNVTPDSFSDGGAFATMDLAVAAGLEMAAAGADIIDVGGESTRPGAAAADPERERERVVPVVRKLAAAGLVVSIDSRRAATMRAALDAGARIVNDVSGLAHDPEAAALVSERGCPVVLMHMRGEPATMMARAKYADVASEVKAELMAHVAAADCAGVARECIALDPGIGFAKRAEHSTELLRRLGELAALGFPLLVGLSRKGFIGRLSGEPVASKRVGGSVAAGLFAVSRGASILRVHDVAATVQALRVWQALSG